MKKLLATFAVTTLLVILAVSEFVIDYVCCYDVDEIPFVK